MQLELNREISRLETQLRVVNIVLIPALLAVLAIVIGIVLVMPNGLDRLMAMLREAPAAPPEPRPIAEATRG